MKSDKSIVIGVESGLQCLNAIELVEYLKIEYKKVLLVLFVNINQLRKLESMNKILTEYNANIDVVYINGELLKSNINLKRPYSIIDRYKLAKNSIRELIDISNRICGDVKYYCSMNRSIFIELGRLLKADIFILIDGGSSKLKEIKEPLQLHEPDFMMRYVGFRSWKPKNLIHFTSYYLESNSNNFIPNKYLWLKKLANNKVSEDTVLFIGYPIKRSSQKLKKINFIAFKKVKKIFNSKKIIYVPHPSDRPLSDHIRKLLGTDIIIEENSLPVELMIAKGDTIPKRIITFTSSSIANLVSAYGDIIEIYLIDSREFNSLMIERLPKEYPMRLEGIKKYNIKTFSIN